jgi:hypothetical protein
MNDPGGETANERNLWTLGLIGCTASTVIVIGAIIRDWQQPWFHEKFMAIGLTLLLIGFPIRLVIDRKRQNRWSQGGSYSWDICSSFGQRLFSNIDDRTRLCLRPAGSSPAFVHHSPLQHKIHPLQNRDVLQRISRHRNDVRQLADFNRPNLILHPQQL